ncbi:MAG TPA: hypothetical protein VJI33_03335 [Candidatus Paceibacterota bacterium]
MTLELHDAENGNSLVARVSRLDYDYQAEIWVDDTATRNLAYSSVIKWVLIDELGVRCVWERPQPGNNVPDITERSSRFEGVWERGPNEVSISDPFVAGN